MNKDLLYLIHLGEKYYNATKATDKKEILEAEIEKYDSIEITFKKDQYKPGENSNLYIYEPGNLCYYIIKGENNYPYGGLLEGVNKIIEGNNLQNYIVKYAREIILYKGNKPCKRILIPKENTVKKEIRQYKEQLKKQLEKCQQLEF